MFRWIWLVGLAMILTACGGENSSQAVTSSTPSRTPAFGSSGATQLNGCDPNQVLTWELRFIPPSLERDTIEQIRQAERNFESLNYPSCLSVARGHALEVYDLAARALEARYDSNFTRETSLHAEFDEALNDFDAEMRNVEAKFTAPPTAVPTEQVSCPSRMAQCSVLTCAQAYACYADGNKTLDSDDDGIPCENICQ